MVVAAEQQSHIVRATHSFIMNKKSITQQRELIQVYVRDLDSQCICETVSYFAFSSFAAAVAAATAAAAAAAASVTLFLFLIPFLFLFLFFVRFIFCAMVLI